MVKFGDSVVERVMGQDENRIGYGLGVAWLVCFIGLAISGILYALNIGALP